MKEILGVSNLSEFDASKMSPSQLQRMIRALIDSGQVLGDSSMCFRNIRYVKDGKHVLQGVSGWVKPGLMVSTLIASCTEPCLAYLKPLAVYI